MNAFVRAAKSNQKTRTENGMKTNVTSGDAVVDLFSKVGSMREQNVIPLFSAAYAQDRELALRVMLWARDIRGGAGARKVFRDVLNHLATNDPVAAKALMAKTPEVGRWDDLFSVVDNAKLRNAAFEQIELALKAHNGLAAKWMPRKGPVAKALREYLELSPKRYRKMLAGITKVVEQQMSTKQWHEINYSHVPSVASKKYRKAFWRNDKDRYEQFVNAAKTGKTFKGKAAKINASAIYPHDVIAPLVQRLRGSWGRYNLLNHQVSATEADAIEAQWNSLPNYVGDANVIAMCDVSGSMQSVRLSNNVNPLMVSISLGLYCADKNTGPFHGIAMSFSGKPKIRTLSGSIREKINQICNDDWGMNTDLHAAMEAVLKLALDNNVSAAEMPKIIVVFTDLQFDHCVRYDDSAMQMIRRKFENAGYPVPQIVFWDLAPRVDQSAVKFNEHGVALVSGFSPAILETVLSADLSSYTPRSVMMKKIMQDRYAVQLD